MNHDTTPELIIAAAASKSTWAGVVSMFVGWLVSSNAAIVVGATVEAASLRRYLNLVNASEYINLKDEETIKGVQALEYVGILGKDRAQEILETPVTDQERYTAQG